MTDKTHQLIGLVAATAGYIYLHPNNLVTWSIATTVIIGSVMGSVMPDIDQPTASAWDNVPLGGFMGKLTSRALGGHRNLSHSLLGIALFSGLVYWLVRFIPPNSFINPTILWQSFTIGFVAHLLADAVTVMGIPLLWPFGDNMGFPPYPFHGIRIITGKWFENLIVFPLTIVLLVIVLMTYSALFCPILLVLCKNL